MPTPPTPVPTRSPALPAAGEATSPLWRIWVPLVLGSVVSSLVFTGLAQKKERPAVTAQTRWVEATADSGITHQHRPRLLTDSPIPTSLGAGVTVFDYNQDGAKDLLFLTGGAWPWEDAGGRIRTLSAVLYRNDGRGTFSDVTVPSGVATTFIGMAASAADFDHDGWCDFIVVGVGGVALLRNNGDGTFANVTALAGLPSEDHVWRSAVTWLDLNRDGWLDLIILPYARWPEELNLIEALDVASGGRSYGTPIGFSADFPLCYLNQGDGRFVPAPDHAGLEAVDPETRSPRAWPVALLPVDANADALPDLLLQFSQGAPVLFLGRQDGGFRRAALGSEFRREGDAVLGVSAALDASSPSVDSRSQVLLRWANRATAAPTTLPGDLSALQAWDFNQDGRQESWLLGGPLELQPRLSVDMETLRGPVGLVGERVGETQLTPLLPNLAEEEAPTVFRSAVAVDLENDGDLDLVATRVEGGPLILRNEPRTTLPWLVIDLGVEANEPVPYGARVELHTPRGVLRQTYLPVQALGAQADERLFFGLADDSRVRKVVVRWPDGGQTETKEPKLNRVLRLRR